MRDNDLNVICMLVQKRGSYLLGRNYRGQRILKIPFGPFDCFSHRFQVDELTLTAIREKLAGQNLH